MTYEQATELGTQAWLALDEADFEKAHQIGMELMEAGWESGYRILSAVEEGQENWAEAEQWLEKGIQASPEIWQLHLQLGTLCALQGRFDEALQHYEKCLELPEVDASLVALNQAGAMAQSGPDRRSAQFAARD